MRTFYLLCTFLTVIGIKGFAQVSSETELREAINAAGSNGSTTVTISQDFEVSDQILIEDGKTVTIEGSNFTLSVTSPGLSDYRIFKVTGGSTLTVKELTLAGGILGNTDNEDNYGGVIYAENADLIAESITVENVKAYKGGAVYVKDGKLDIKGNSQFTGNEAYNFGGAVYVEADDTQVEISPEIKFSSNIAKDAGGALYLKMEKGIINIGNQQGSSLVEFYGNQALAACRGGGAVFISHGELFGDPTETLDITVKAKFEENICHKGACKYTVQGINGCFDSQGGALYVYGGTNLSIMENSSFHMNDADGGGGLYLHNTKNVTVEKGVRFTENTAIYAGALCVYGAIMEMNEVEFSENSVRGNEQDINNGNANAIFSENSILTINNSKFIGNFVDHENVYAGMGTITNVSTSELYLDNCTFSDNRALYGGAISSDGILNINSCSFSNNSAGQMGGGIYNRGNLAITNSLFTKNSTGRYGGAIFSNSNQPSVYNIFTNITITDNTAGTMGSGLFTDCLMAPVIRNTIIWGNNGSDLKMFNTQAEYEYSLIGGFTTNENGNIDGDTDPLLNADYKPLAGSPVIDAGNNDYYTSDLSHITKDLAGNNRILLGRTGLTVDMGAYEYVAPIPPSVTYSISLTVAPGITANYSAGSLTVNEYDHLQLTFRTDESDTDMSEILFLINGEEATCKTFGNGQFSYNLNSITCDYSIEIALREYPVIFAGVECIILDAKSTAQYGQPFTFSLIPGEQDCSEMITRVNEEEISPVLNDNSTLTYTIAKVTGPVVIQLEGIECDDTTGNVAIGNDMKISGKDGQMIIESIHPQSVNIYDINGRLITTRKVNGETIILLNAGIYIVRTEKDSVKIIVE